STCKQSAPARISADVLILARIHVTAHFFVAPRAHRDEADGNSGQLFEAIEVPPRLAREIVPLARGRRGRAPSGKPLRDGTGGVQLRERLRHLRDAPLSDL